MKSILLLGLLAFASLGYTMEDKTIELSRSEHLTFLGGSTDQVRISNFNGGLKAALTLNNTCSGILFESPVELDQVTELVALNQSFTQIKTQFRSYYRIIAHPNIQNMTSCYASSVIEGSADIPGFDKPFTGSRVEMLHPENGGNSIQKCKEILAAHPN